MMLDIAIFEAIRQLSTSRDKDDEKQKYKKRGIRPQNIGNYLDEDYPHLNNDDKIALFKGGRHNKEDDY